MNEETGVLKEGRKWATTLPSTSRFPLTWLRLERFFAVVDGRTYRWVFLRPDKTPLLTVDADSTIRAGRERPARSGFVVRDQVSQPVLWILGEELLKDQMTASDGTLSIWDSPPWAGPASCWMRVRFPSEPQWGPVTLDSQSVSSSGAPLLQLRQERRDIRLMRLLDPSGRPVATVTLGKHAWGSVSGFRLGVLNYEGLVDSAEAAPNAILHTMLAMIRLTGRLRGLSSGFAGTPW